MGSVVAASHALSEDIICVKNKDFNDTNIGLIVCSGDCMETIRIDYKLRYLEDGTDTRAKQWKSDHTTKLCQDCRAQFGSFTRKHHCRMYVYHVYS